MVAWIADVAVMKCHIVTHMCIDLYNNVQKETICFYVDQYFYIPL